MVAHWRPAFVAALGMHQEIMGEDIANGCDTGFNPSFKRSHAVAEQACEEAEFTLIRRDFVAQFDERCANSLANNAADDGGMNCIKDLCATIVATISETPHQTATETFQSSVMSVTILQHECY